MIRNLSWGNHCQQAQKHYIIQSSVAGSRNHIFCFKQKETILEVGFLKNYWKTWWVGCVFGNDSCKSPPYCLPMGAAASTTSWKLGNCCLQKFVTSENSLAVYWLELCTSTAGDMALISGWGTKNLQAMQHGQKFFKNKKKKRNLSLQL